ncbi:helix-turn-helix transcriptional regulator [Novosphingobium sp. RL4]|uniref:helix-turn-helix domain-containing protein n=1 Tax=Novosphingobium sp. RL4 TaxID=3109595 RepID=UPI002D7A2000|nr:helix-turn-helix transcriptional regulator [Novosphingobium sp. RL4]WRT91347.1 helix-turn-helix transcriptional regulator [Novosphingobium sp. RL4]
MSADILHFVPMDEAPNRIRELRMQAKLSQQALGDAVGVSKMTISDLERGNMRLDTEYLRRVARALGVLPADLLSLSDNPGALTIEERRFIEQLRSASPEQRDQLHKVADVIAPYKEAEDAQPYRSKKSA